MVADGKRTTLEFVHILGDVLHSFEFEAVAETIENVYKIPGLRVVEPVEELEAERVVDVWVVGVYVDIVDFLNR